MFNERDQTHQHRVAAWVAVAGACIACSGAWAQEIYKSTDAQGRTIYSDRPLTAGSERLNILQRPRNVTGESGEAPPSGAPPLAAQTTPLADRDAQISEAAAAARKKADAAEFQASRCKQAQVQYRLFADGRPRFHLDNAGNRVAFTYEELAAKRESTRVEMERECSGQSPD